MPETSPEIVFNPNDFIGNVNQLIQLFRYKKESDVQVTRFVIESPNNKKLDVMVGDGKYKSAIFLLYLSILEMNERIIMTERLRKLTRNYFGEELCQDAIKNPEKHVTIRNLLMEDAIVFLSFEPQH